MRLIRYQEIAESLDRGLAAGGGVTLAVRFEQVLCERYRASRTTIRVALKSLQERGLIERRQGQRSFYRPRHIAKHLGSLVDFHTEARFTGSAPTTRTLEPCAVSAEVAAQLALVPGTTVFRSQRVARVAAGAVFEVSDTLSCSEFYRFTIHRDVTDAAPRATA